MRNRYIITTMTIILSIFTINAQIQFSASTQRTKVSMGEQILITAQLVTPKNPGKVIAPQVASNESFSVLQTDQRQSSNSSIQIINGQATQKTEIIINFLYVITPKSAGAFTFPSLVTSVNGKEYKTKPITFSVSNEVVKNPDIKVILTLDKRNLYVGEQTILTFKIAQRGGASVDISNSFSPALEKIEQAFAKSFALIKLFTNQVTSATEMLDGESYKVYLLRFALVPLAAGTTTIDRIPVQYSELQRRSRQRSDPFFDDFFNSNFFGGGVQAIGRSAQSNSLTIDVKALPSPAPKGFTGAVGTFSVSSDISAQEIPAGESITLRVKLHGTARPGSIGSLILPEIADCEIFKPEKQISVDTTASGINTRQTYKYLLIPRQEGLLSIPSVTFPYFDPKSGTFMTASSAPITINVTPGKEGTETQTRYLTQEEIKEVGKDIRYIKTDEKIVNQSRYPHRNPIFIILFPLPFIFFILSVLYRIQASKKDITTVRNIRKKALASALRKITLLKKHGSTLSAADFSGKITEIIEQFISHKFGFAATGRTLDELKNELEQATSNTDTISELTSFMALLDSYRFGGASFNEQSRTNVLEKTREFLSKINNETKKSDKNSVSKTITTLLFLLALLQITKAAPINSWFDKANEFYSNQNYDSAVIYYEKIVESGIQSSPVFYNLGNAFYRLKKIGLSRLYFEKALLLDPMDKDIQTNILFVNSNIIDRIPEPEHGLFYIIFQQLHHFLSLGSQLWLVFILLILISSLLSSILFISGNLRLWLIYSSVLLSLLTIGIGISLGIKIYNSENITHAVLLSSTVDAKNEPDGNKILFTAHEGTKFRIRKETDKWSLVSLPNGVSGWIKSSDLGKI